MTSLASDCVTDRNEGWEDTVITILCLVVQHCPGASADPKALCRLLQVSPACRTALQRVRGHCSPTLKAESHLEMDKFPSHMAWAATHSSLVRVLTVDVNGMDPLRDVDELQPSDLQVAAALATLLNLHTFSFITPASNRANAFGQQMLEALSGQTQLTRVGLNVTAGALPCLPASVVDASLIVDVSATAATEAPAPPPCVSFQHLPALQSLSVRVWEDVNDDHQHNSPDPSPSWPRFEVAVPPQLTDLQVGEVAGGVAGGEQQSLARVQRLMLWSPDMPVARLAQVLDAMPRLRELELDGETWVIGRPCRLTNLSAEDTHALFRAIGRASQLTSLSVSGYDFGLTEEAGGDGVIGGQLQRLTALQSLHSRAHLVLRARDVRGIASLTQLTSLRLRNCGPGVRDQQVQELCVKLTQLRHLTLNNASFESGADLLGAAAQLTNLVCLDLLRNTVDCISRTELALLSGMVKLTSLRLPSAVEERYDANDLRRVVFAELPALESVDVGWGTYKR